MRLLRIRMRAHHVRWLMLHHRLLLRGIHHTSRRRLGGLQGLSGDRTRFDWLLRRRDRCFVRSMPAIDEQVTSKFSLFIEYLVVLRRCRGLVHHLGSRRGLCAILIRWTSHLLSRSWSSAGSIITQSPVIRRNDHR